MCAIYSMVNTNPDNIIYFCVEKLPGIFFYQLKTKNEAVKAGLKVMWKLLKAL